MQIKRFIGFTIAEVLITICIVGIVATIILPGLIVNIEKQIAVAKVKEIYSMLSQATNQINKNCGGDVSGCLAAPNAADNNAAARNDLARIYKSEFNIVKDCTDGVTTNCFVNENIKYLRDYPFDWHNLSTAIYASNSAFVLKNGMVLGFDWDNNGSYYFTIDVDINGNKGPNRMGKDVFFFVYDQNKKIIISFPSNDCTTSDWGQGCAAKVLVEGAINYY